METPRSLPELRKSLLEQPGFSREELLREVIAQVKKDFAPGAEIRLTSEDLEGLLAGVISALDTYASGFDLHSIMRILYRVDVKEKPVKEALMNSNRNEALEQIAVMIIFRCLQKVLTRKYYK